jgi:hypothetical protein
MSDTTPHGAPNAALLAELYALAAEADRAVALATTTRDHVLALLAAYAAGGES